MASPAFVATTNGTGNATSFTAGEPAGSASGDALLMGILLEDGYTGFTIDPFWGSPIFNTDVGAFHWRLYAGRRTGSAPNYDVSWTSSKYYEWSTYAFSGIVASGAFVESSAAGTPAPGTQPDPPAVTTLTADTTVVTMVTSWWGFAAAVAAPTNYTKRFAADGYDHALATRTIAAAGVEDPGQFGAAGGSDDACGFTLVLASLASGGGGGGTSDPIVSSGRRNCRANAVYRMSDRSQREAQQLLKAQKRSYSFATASL